MADSSLLPSHCSYLSLRVVHYVLSSKPSLFIPSHSQALPSCREPERPFFSSIRRHASGLPAHKQLVELPQASRSNSNCRRSLHPPLRYPNLRPPRVGSEPPSSPSPCPSDNRRHGASREQDSRNHRAAPSRAPLLLRGNQERRHVRLHA